MDVSASESHSKRGLVVSNFFLTPVAPLWIVLFWPPKRSLRNIPAKKMPLPSCCRPAFGKLETSCSWKVAGPACSAARTKVQRTVRKTSQPGYTVSKAKALWHKFCKYTDPGSSRNASLQFVALYHEGALPQQMCSLGALAKEPEGG